MLGMAIVSFSACNGILEGIYDEPQEEETKEYGFITVDSENHSGTVYINATDYMRWTYIDFHSLTIDSLQIDTLAGHVQQDPADWDIAIHRYDVRTNGGAVLETGSTGFTALQNASKMPEGTYVEDEWSKVTVDMSHMMEGYLVYSECYLNPELCKWLNVDTSSMPPTYTPSNKVYMVRLKDSTYAAVRLSNYMNASGVKGYMTIDYIYPFELK